MNILLLTSYLGNKGGLGRYSHEIVKGLRTHGMQVRILGENTHAPLYDEKNILVPVFRQSGLKKIKIILKNIWLCRVEARSCKVIHACDGWPYALYGYCAVIGTSKKLFITGIGTYTIAPLKEKTLKGKLIRRAYVRADAIFCISDYVRDLIKMLEPRAKVETVLMGTTELSTVSLAETEALKAKYAIKDRYPLVLTVGDIKDRKGQLDTLKSLYLLKDQFPHFLYVLIGSSEDVVYVGKIKEFIKQHALSKNVLIISDMYDDSILSFFYQACDLFALNSTNDGNHFEGFGLVLLEAAQFGKPSIGSRGCGIESAIKDGFSGYLTEQGNTGDIAVKIKQIIFDKEKKMNANALVFYKDFSWIKTVRTYISRYTTKI